jgi:hypothetical protein
MLPEKIKKKGLPVINALPFSIKNRGARHWRCRIGKIQA